MTEHGGLWLAMGLLAVGVGGGAWLYRRAAAWVQAARGAHSLVRGLELQQELLAETPKSISGMTRLLLPQIMQDFPAFSWEEFRQRAENSLQSALLCITAQSAENLSEPSDALRRQVALIIEDCRSRGERECYEEIHLHRTEIVRYEKRQGRCVVTLQSAVEYLRYTLSEDGTLCSGSRERKVQTRYDLELVYIQDAEKASESAGDRAVGMTCPSCGAPITSLGQKSCAYCGLAVTELNRYVWSIHRFCEA
ncbi:MAG: hypothetical protein RR197_03605 [Oscillospiraceae bacterium]